MITPKPPLPLRKRLQYAGLFVLLTLILLFIAGEITVRLMGYGAWRPEEKIVHTEPGSSFFQVHPELGFISRPGKYSVTLDGRLTFDAQHDSLGYRICPANPDSGAAKGEIWIMGCSFTYGWGVGPEECYPCILQKMLPEYRVRNFGVPGYGTLQSLFQLKSELKGKKAPVLLILGYGGFHDQRNTCNRFWRKAVSPQKVLEGLEYPYSRLDGRDSLVLGRMPLSWQPFPGLGWSAFLHFLEIQQCRNEDNRLRSHEVSRRLISEIGVACRQAGTKFMVAGIYREAASREMLGWCARQGWDTLDISLDLDRPDLRILPDDGHPNAKAHLEFAGSLWKGLLRFY